MSNHQHADDDDIPRFEPWLGVTASSLIPAVIALYASRVLIPSIVATVALFLTGMLMLRRQTVASSRAAEPSGARSTIRRALGRHRWIRTSQYVGAHRARRPNTPTKFPELEAL